MSHSLAHYYQSNDSSGSHVGKAPISSAHNSFFGLAEYNQTRSTTTGYIPSETRYNGLDMPRNHRQEDNLTIIGSASRQMLLASENAAYFELFQDNMRLKAELNAKIELIAYLKENNKIPIANHPITSSSTTNQPNTLVIPNPPPPCDQDDFEDVRFWTRAEWNAFTEKQREKGITPPKLGFICQENGKVASDARLTAMGQQAQELWAELYRERQDPPSWKAKTRTAADFFSNSMRLKFDEFRYCDNDWKIEAFATIRYPDFVRYPRASGRLARRDPSLRSSLKRKSDADDAHTKGSKPLPPKKRKIAVLLPQDVVEVDSDSDAGIQSAASTMKGKVGSYAISSKPRVKPSILSHPCSGLGESLTTTTSSSEPITTPEPVSATTSISTPDVQVAVAASIETILPSPIDPPAQTPSLTLTSTPASDEVTSVENTPVVSTPTELIPDIATTTLPAGISEQSPISTCATASSPNSVQAPELSTQMLFPPVTISEPEPPTQIFEEGLPPSRLRQTLASQSGNILSNITIPKPAANLLAPVVNAAASSSTSAVMATHASGSTKKGDKLMKANNSLTARNLYAIDHLKTHAPTISEFKAIYDALDKATLKAKIQCPLAQKEGGSLLSIADPTCDASLARDCHECKPSDSDTGS